MKNQQHQVKLTLQEAMALVETDYKELNNIKPSDYTKEEYADICKNAIDKNSLALEYIDPENLNEDVYKEICISALNSVDYDDEYEIRELFDNIKITSLKKEGYKDILIKCLDLIKEQCINNELNFLELVDDEKAAFLGQDLYADVCKKAVSISIINIEKVKTKLFEGTKNNHYYDICMQAVISCNHALIDITIELLTAEQLKTIVMQALENLDRNHGHPLDTINDRNCYDDRRAVMKFLITRNDECPNDWSNSIKQLVNQIKKDIIAGVMYENIHEKLKGTPYEEICLKSVKNLPYAFEYIKKDLLCTDKAHPKNDEIYKELALIAVESYKDTSVYHPLKVIKAKDFIKEDYKDICIKAVTTYPESLQFVDRTKFSKETYEEIEILAKNSKKILDEQDSNDMTNKAVSIEKDLQIGFKRPFNETTLNQDNEEDTGPGKKQEVSANDIMQLKHEDIQQQDIEHEDSSAMGQYNDIDH